MISILDQNFTALNTYIDNTIPSKLFILVDENTHHHCLPILLANLETDIPFEIIEIESGEDLKTIETATQLWEILSEFEADRKALMINLGGGVITDMGGFVASTYKRGIKFINVPTTLLSMCDASIGGKTGIDHGFLKNIIGTFAHAEEIFVYPAFLETLSFVELRSGFAEMLKHGLIADQTHWQDLIAIVDLSPEKVYPFIENSMKIKQNVVETDFKEQNIRKTLNFGHTIGHAIESLCLQKGTLIPHGEAVALGMICEAKLSESEGMLSAEKTATVISNIKRYYHSIDISSFSDEQMLALMRNDKKNDSNSINFVLLSDIGTAVFDCKISEDKILAALSFYKEMA